jgi:pyridoxine kinase
MMLKRAAAIHDLSGLGRCSLTMALPVLSAMGVQCCPLPTAVLSAQTDGYRGYSLLELTDEMPKYIEHWKQNNEKFDAIYTGFLASPRQIDIVEDFIDTFASENTLVLVDPVMGDGGAVYDSVSPDTCAGIRRLVAKANIITPNLTEAAILLGEKNIPDDRHELLNWAKRLCGLGPAMAVITGIDHSEGRLGVALSDADGEDMIYTAHIARDYPGAGDMFASVLLGKLMDGATLREGAEFAAKFVTECAALTYKLGTPAREGLAFEALLHLLMN